MGGLCAKEEAKSAVPTVEEEERAAEATGFHLNVAKIYSMVERQDLAVYQELGGLAGIVRDLRTNITTGLAADPAARESHQREARYGRNVIPPAERVSYPRLVIAALSDKMLLLLIACAFLSIILGATNPAHADGSMNTDWIEGLAILISVTIVVLVSTINDYRKAKKFEKLEEVRDKKEVEVLRGGQKVRIDSSLVQVGDVLFIEAGQLMSCDAVVIDAEDLVFDESAVNGESDPKKKRPDTAPFLISGTSVSEGAGRGVVVLVGECSFSGRLMMGTRGEAAETPLQEKLGDLAELIGKIGTVCAAITFTVLAIREIIDRVRDGKWSENRKNFVNHFIISIAVIVVAVPEGLPLAVTIALAYSMQNMMKDNCLVRVLAACETMGAATAIASDKTGTLTTNVMTCVAGWIAGTKFDVPGTGTRPGSRNDPVALPAPPNVVEAFAEGVALNSTASQQPNERGVRVWVGNKTEHGILGLITRIPGASYEDRRARVPRERVRQFPFSSAKKRMSTSVLLADGAVATYVKGASEMVLADCVSYYTSTGAVAAITDAVRGEVEAAIRHYADQACRTIGVAEHRSAPAAGGALPAEEPAVPLTLVGILAIEDPVRPEVPHAVAQCQRAGVVVRMVTGDNIFTAQAIGRQCNILDGSPQEIAIEGREFRRMAEENPARLRRLLPSIRVVARATPQDKFVLVENLQILGNVVAVTGDGTNDAPALKKADVGFAMNSGTDIAKAASKIVLLDDNFVSVVRACVWGRNVNDSIRKFLQFQLTINCVGVALTVIGSAGSGVPPLSPVQLLWLNLIMDTFAALALATEQPCDKVLEREPVIREAPLVSHRMWSFILVHGAYQLTVILLLLYTGHLWGLGFEREDPRHLTTVFNTMIWMQVFNMFNARKLYGGEYVSVQGLFKYSRMFVFLALGIAAFQVAAVEVPIFNEFMHCDPNGLNAPQWIVSLAIGAFELLWGIAVKAVPISEPIFKQGGARQVVFDEETSRLRTMMATSAAEAGGESLHSRRITSMFRRLHSDYPAYHPSPTTGGSDRRGSVHGASAHGGAGSAKGSHPKAAGAV